MFGCTEQEIGNDGWKDSVPINGHTKSEKAAKLSSSEEGCSV